MSSRKPTEPLTKVTLNIFSSDYDRLRYLYAENYSAYIRHLIRANVTRTDAAIAAEGETLSSEVEFEV